MDNFIINNNILNNIKLIKLSNIKNIRILKISSNGNFMILCTNDEIKIYDIRIREVLINNIKLNNELKGKLNDIEWINNDLCILLCQNILYSLCFSNNNINVLIALKNIYLSVKLNKYNTNICCLFNPNKSIIYNLKDNTVLLEINNSFQSFIGFLNDYTIITFTTNLDLQYYDINTQSILSSQKITINNINNSFFSFCDDLKEFCIIDDTNLSYYKYINNIYSLIFSCDNKKKYKCISISYDHNYFACVYESELTNIYIYDNNNILISDVNNDTEIKKIIWSSTNNILYIINKDGILSKIQSFIHSKSAGIMFPSGYVVIPRNQYYIEREDEFDYREDESRNYEKRDYIDIINSKNNTYTIKYYIPKIEFNEVELIDSYLDEIKPISKEDGEKIIRDSMIYSNKC